MFRNHAKYNLGTFNTTHMDELSQSIFLNYASMNAVDSYAYPEILAIQSACAKFISERFCGDESIHVLTTSGSSEAIFLTVLAYKLLNKSQSNQPNFILFPSAHMAWIKACDYLGVQVKLCDYDGYHPTIEAFYPLIDEHTIGINATLGCPMTLTMDDIFLIHQALAERFKTTSHFVPLHIDAASGGFVFPFINEWKTHFGLPHVCSVNVSSHKYGGVYPSLGWLLLRKHYLNERMIQSSDYLGVTIERSNIQFSHSAAPLMTQYHLMNQWGISGYTTKTADLYNLQAYLTACLTSLNFPMVIYNQPEKSLPGIVFKFNEINMQTLALQLKKLNWSVPVYPLSFIKGNPYVMRIVIRHGFTKNFISLFFKDLNLALKKMTQITKPMNQAV